jgi:hypothetical protein
LDNTRPEAAPSLAVRGIAGLAVAVRGAAWLEEPGSSCAAFTTSRCDLSRSVVRLRAFLGTPYLNARDAATGQSVRLGLGRAIASPNLLREGTRAHALRRSRLCYDHRSAVAGGFPVTGRSALPPPADDARQFGADKLEEPHRVGYPQPGWRIRAENLHALSQR